MSPIEFAARKVVFRDSSPITGRFDISKYRMLEKPLMSLADIRIKRTVTYKASSALGTVFLQIALAYRLDQSIGNCYLVGSSKDDAAVWSKTRGKKWLSSIPSISETMSDDKHAVTNSLFLWPHQWLEIQGPGENAQQGRQCTYLFTDESHVKEYSEGALAALEERMGKRWNRHALHNTTAADAGKEVDRYYYMGGQNEFHLCCPKCHKLTWPLWEDDARKEYNGERVFHFESGSSEARFVCPWCGKVYSDSSRERYALHEGADYVTKNPDHLPENESFRWNCWAAWWMPWSDHLAKYREAIETAKMGNLGPHENWVKKRLCQSYVPEIPNLGEGQGASDYEIGSVWVVQEEKARFCSFDVQDEGGFHLWGQCDEFLRNGDSRRVDYKKLLSWDEARAFQQHHGAEDQNTYMDAGHRMREVFAKCAAWKWYALFSEDADEFPNLEKDPSNPNGPQITIRRPYTKPLLEDSMSGKRNTDANKQLRIVRGVPPGYCLSRRWSKPTIGGYLMALKSGNSRYYGIGKGIDENYIPQLNSYTFAKVVDKKYGTTEVILKQVRAQDHSFATSSMCLVGALIRGFFPLALDQKSQEQTV